MDPIIIILYGVGVSLLLTLVLPRIGQVDPRLKRYLWLFAAGGLLALGLLYGVVAGAR